MKKMLTVVLVIFCNTVFSQKTEFSILGKWQKIAENGNDGAHDYTQKVENGEILFFENNSIVKDGIGNSGVYELNEHKLKIKLNEKENYYLAYHDNDDLALTPVTSDYQILCDEGCAYIYKSVRD